MIYTLEIDEYNHFYRSYEDYKHGLFILHLNDEVEKWMIENLTDCYDINCDNYFVYNNSHIIVEFTDETDAIAFKLRWL